MLKLAALFVLLLAGLPALAQQAFPFLNTPGAFTTGFRVVQQHDVSRSYPSITQGMPRPIQTAIWYPAQKGGQAMRYDDYLQLQGWDDDFDRSPADRNKVLADWLKMVTGSKPTTEIAAEMSNICQQRL